MHDRHHECHANADCFNTYGSYICVCKDEFRAREAVAMQGVISTDCAAASTPPCRTAKTAEAAEQGGGVRPNHFKKKSAHHRCSEQDAKDRQ